MTPDAKAILLERTAQLVAEARRRLSAAIMDGRDGSVILPLQGAYNARCREWNDAGGQPREHVCEAHKGVAEPKLKPMRAVTRRLEDGEFGRWTGYMRGDELAATAMIGGTG